MEPPAEPGPGKKPPQRSSARPTGSTRKPPPARKPSVKRPVVAKPAAKGPVKAAAKPIADVEPETAIEAPDAPTEVAAEVAGDATPAEFVAAEDDHPAHPAGMLLRDPPQYDEPAEAEAADELVEADVAPEPDVTPEPEIVPEPEAEPEPEPEPELEPEPEPGIEPNTGEPADSPATLGAVSAWTKRVATISGARIGTMADQAATSARSGAASFRERRALAREASRQRSESRELARLTRPAAIPAGVETTIEFDLETMLEPSEFVLSVTGLTKRFDDKVAVKSVDLSVRPGAFYGIVGPNGAGKTTTLSMITGLLRPDEGTVSVYGADVWSNPVVAKRNMGVLPDRLRLFDRLTGGQLLYYAGVLRGLDASTVKRRTADLARAFGLEEALGRLVSDYSAGMTKKVALAAAMIHSPRLLVLDEPFESVDPVSSATVTEILKKYVEAGGTVVLSSHSMELVQRICDNVAVVVNGEILADGTIDEVRGGSSLEERFVELAGGRTSVEGLEWLHSFSD